jgi:4-methyl-5(b-hydroxyethyl)-thiazole monophosphate biosynthesis
MVYVLLGTGFEETEAIAPIDLLRRAGVEVLTVGLNGKTVYGGHGIGIEADITEGEMDLTAMEMIVLPGGLGGVASIRASEAAMNAIRFAYENSLYTAACTDGKLITGTSAGCAVAFGLALIAALKGEEAARAVEKQIVIR